MRGSIAAMVLTCVPAPVFAWGAAGHALIIDLAYERLDRNAAAEFERLLAAAPAQPVDGCDLKTRHDVATWPDCVRFKDPFKTSTSTTSRFSEVSRRMCIVQTRSIFRCPVCDKKFRRDKYDSQLNPHKHPSEFQCSGRTGHYVDTKY